MNYRCLPINGTNCYVLWDDDKDAVILDPADEAETILAFIKEQQLRVHSVVLTHAHFDHMMAAKAVCAAFDAPLLVGAGDKETLSDPRLNLSALFLSGVSLSLSCNGVLREGDTLAVGKESLTIWETPGHTDGCVCLVGDGVVFTGDTLFYGSIGRLDFPTGNEEAMSRSLARLMTLPSHTVVYSGHGPATTIGRERLQNPYLR